MTYQEKYYRLLETMKQLAKRFDPDFDHEVEHWEWGNMDDSWQYGYDCSAQETASVAVHAPP